MARYRNGQKRGTTTSFTKVVRDSSERFMADAESVYQETNKILYDRLEEETPKDTGHLAGSLVATVSGNVESSGPTNVTTGEGSGRAESYMNIDSAKITDKINFFYRATYFLYVNYGTVNMRGRFWVERVRAEYPSIARAVARRYGLKVK